MALTIITPDISSEDANSYVSAEYVENYSKLLGSTLWRENESQWTVACIQASRFIDLRYRKRLPGTLFEPTQALLWPRTAYIDATGRSIQAGTLPRALKDAVAQAAIQFVQDGTLDLQPNQNNTVKKESVSVGGGAVSESVEYFFPAESNIYAVLDSLMNVALPASSLSPMISSRYR